MKKVKRITASIILLAVMLFNVLALAIPASAASTGMTFTKDTLYSANKKISAVPMTFEARLKINSADPAAYLGTVIGLYTDEDNAPGILFDIARGGPRIYMSVEGKSAGVRFDNTLTDYVNQEVHVAITIDPSTQTTTLYINGEKVRDATDAGDGKDYEYSVNGGKNWFWLAYEKLTALRLPLLTVGGDQRVDASNINGGKNWRYFTGTIYSAGIFSDVRAGYEIAADKNGMPQNDSDLLAWYNTNELSGGVIPDKSGKGYDLAVRSDWLNERTTPLQDYAYSFAIVGDTQVITRDEAVMYVDPPENTEKNTTYSADFNGHFSKIYDYIVGNQESKNIQFAFHMGDVTDWNYYFEWDLAMQHISKMDGKIPYNIIRGNHDNAKTLTERWSMDKFVSNIANGEEYGTFDGNTLNTYQTITVGKIKYLMLTLDFGAGKAMIEWANKVVEAHPYHNVIVSTHSYLRPDGTYVDYLGDPTNLNDCSGSNYNPGRIFGMGSSMNYDYRLKAHKDGGTDYLHQDASYMWNNLIKKHENIVMVLCGHEISDYILNVEAVGDHGNKIAQVLIDPQGLDRDLQAAGQGHAGLVAMFYFSEDGRNVQVEYYSTIRQQYYKADNIYSFELNVINADTASELESAISTAEGLDRTKYTESSWNALMSTLTLAKTFVGSHDEASLDVATSSLLTAISSLEEKSNTNVSDKNNTGTGTNTNTNTNTNNTTNGTNTNGSTNTNNTQSNTDNNQAESNNGSETQSVSDNKSDSQKDEKKSGCASSISASALILSAVLSLGIVATRKRKNE